MNRDNSLDLLAAQAIFCRCRHQPRRPPLAKMRPGSPALTIGPGTTRNPRISPPGNAVLWMFKYVSPACSALDTPLDAAMTFPVNKIPISTVIEGRGAEEMVALVLRRRIGRIRASHLHTGGNRRWTC
jgi:hypothetical protein